MGTAGIEGGVGVGVKIGGGVGVGVKIGEGVGVGVKVGEGVGVGTGAGAGLAKLANNLPKGVIPAGGAGGVGRGRPVRD